jgi:hypothetical protein
MLIEPPHPFDVTHPKFRAKLSAISGRLVGQPYCSDEEMTLLATKGILMKGPVKVAHGRPNRCHFNAAVRWLNDPRKVIYFGYQNSSDCWTQHSWNVLDGQIVDTDDRKLYFGVTPVDPEAFAVHVVLDELNVENIDSVLSQRAAKRFRQMLENVLKAYEINKMKAA